MGPFLMRYRRENRGHSIGGRRSDILKGMNMAAPSFLKRFSVLAYGLGCYGLFQGVFLYSVGFIGNFATPTRLDAPADGDLLTAALVNAGLLAMFALQHSGMARPAFKRWWTRIIPQPIERSTYVLFSNVAMIVMFAFWRPLGGMVWEVDHTVGRAAIYSLYGLGWLTVLYATCLINHFDLFGLRQVWCYFRNRPCAPLEFRIPGMYRHVRHPLYVGWLIVMWSAPAMSVSHLMFAIGATGYILVAIVFEERDLVDSLGSPYAEYQRSTPKLIPRFRGLSQSSAGDLPADTAPSNG